MIIHKKYESMGKIDPGKMQLLFSGLRWSLGNYLWKQQWMQKLKVESGERISGNFLAELIFSSPSSMGRGRQRRVITVLS